MHEFGHDSGARVHVVPCDLARLDDVRALAATG